MTDPNDRPWRPRRPPPKRARGKGHAPEPPSGKSPAPERPPGKGHAPERVRASRAPNAHAHRLVRRCAPRRAVAVVAAVLAAASVLAGCTSSAGAGRGHPPGYAPPTAPVTTGRTDGSGLIPPDETDTSHSSTATTTTTSSTSQAPEAATLAWLSGAKTKRGLVTHTDAGKRWQSATPGKYAILGDGWYRFFAPDGSMVGCTSAGSCVGIGSSGRVAVTAGAHDPRLVYTGGGDFVGRYAADGDRLRDPGKVPTLRKSLARSGVDVAGLVNAATLGAPFAGGATGDPHLITAGGVRISTQAAGQFVARTGDPTHAIQLQLEPMAHRHDVSIVSAVAIGADSDVVIAGDSGTLTINGRTVEKGGGFHQVGLSDGAVVGRWPARSRGTTTAVVWRDGGSVVMTANPALGMTVVAHLPHVATVNGLFGTGGTGSSSDLSSRHHAAGNTPEIVTSWRVRPSERLFAPPSETVSPFPTKTASIGRAAKRVAKKACDGHGRTRSEDVAACAFDVAVTGDAGFVPGHVALAMPAEYDDVARPFAARWPALRSRPSADARDLPPNGRIDVTLPTRASRAYRLDVKQSGVVRLVNRVGCQADENPPGMGKPALRVFDATGHAVSDRFAFCGHDKTPTLPAGTYQLVLGNGMAGHGFRARVDVTLP